MSEFENAKVEAQTKSDLSDWSGAPTLTEQTPNESIRLNQEQVVADFNDFSERLFDVTQTLNGVDFLPIGPTGSVLNMWNLIQVFSKSPPLSILQFFYEGLVYDHIEVTCSLSDPKGIAGAVVIGYYPFTDWFGVPFNDIPPKFLLNNMMTQNLLMSPEAQMITFSNCQDVKFTIPWQFNTPYLSWKQLLLMEPTYEYQMPPPGAPILFSYVLASSYVTSLAKLAQLRVYVKFSGLRFLGPRGTTVTTMQPQGGDLNPDGLVPQSGTDVDMILGEGHIVAAAFLTDEPDATPTYVWLQFGDDLFCLDLNPDELVPQSGLSTAAMVAIDTAITVGTEIVSGAVQHAITGDEVGGSNASGTFDNPSAVQLAYVGDSTSVGPPPTTPVFTPWITNPSVRHPILEYLKRPQFIGMQPINGSTSIYYNNPVFPTGYIVGPDQMCTYFRWFSQMSSYWRGTINFHFVILGHPTVETAYNFMIGYLPDNPSPLSSMAQSSILRGVCQGVKHIKVPMPFMTLFDHLPVYDKIGFTHDADYMTAFTPSLVRATFSVVSTMLDVDPVLKVAVFMSAEDDFQFLQPYAIGMNLVENIEPGLVRKGKEKEVARIPRPPQTRSLRKQSKVPMVPQVGLVMVDECFETRAKFQKPTNTMPAITDVEDLMEIWSRCLPYVDENDDDEPEPDFSFIHFPRWWPLTLSDTSTSYTLDGNNSWYCTNDYISLLSSQFLFYRGSLAVKVCASVGGDTPQSGYKYVSLAGPGDIEYRNVNGFRQYSHSPYTYTEEDLPPASNFGNGTICTPVASQPVLDITIPYRASLTWTPTNPLQTEKTYFNVDDHGFIWINSMGFVRHNIILQAESGDLYDAAYRKIGTDYGVAVETLLPPPTLWIAKGSHWEA